MERTLYNALIKHLNKKEITIITGARQLGKTTLLRQLRAYLKTQGAEVSMISFEDPGILASINKHPEQVFLYAKKPIENQNDGPIYLLIDEVQYAKNPSNFLKYLYDTYLNSLKIIVTGSSAFYIDQQFKDSLAGRKKIFILSPFDFSEFLLFKQENNLNDELQLIRSKKEYISVYGNDFNKLLNEYLIYGGYPAVVAHLAKRDSLAN